MFEDECQARGLELFVLPPKRPDLNDCVERAQSSSRYEFYATYDLPHRIDKLQSFVDAFAHRYNHYRPHDAPLAENPRQSISSPQATDDPDRLICAEPDTGLQIMLSRCRFGLQETTIWRMPGENPVDLVEFSNFPRILAHTHGPALRQRKRTPARFLQRGTRWTPRIYPLLPRWRVRRSAG